MKNNLQLIIPMSGLGKRFVEAGYDIPKPLIEIDNIPIIEHVINLFPGVQDVTFICNKKHLKETNMREILLSIKPNCEIIEVTNSRGPVDAVLQAAHIIKDNSEVIISYCDYGTYWNFSKFLEEARNGSFDGSIACYKGFHPHMLGSDNYAFCKETNKELIQIKEKESFTNEKMNEYASNGTYYFKKGSLVKKYFKELIDLNINVKDEFYVSLVYNLLVRDQLKVNLFEIENMLQWGTPYDLEIYKGWSKYFSNIIKKQPVKNNNSDVTLILPMAGKGSRFFENGYDVPKPLLDVNNLPMVIQAVNCLPKFDSSVFICLQEHIDNFELSNQLKLFYPNCKIISIDKTTEGQACTCEIGINEANIDMEKPILISACDNGVYYDTQEYYNLVEDDNNDIIVWTFRNNQTSKVNPDMYAWLKVDENNLIKHVSCKKFIYDDPLKTHAIIGTMYFRKARYFIDGLKKNYQENIRTNGEFYVDDVLNQNIKQGLRLKVFEVKNYICWGTPNDYKTYIYWRDFFNKCHWHPYKIGKDITYEK
jgi:NDP-sugar pyrophosphorylase family protein